MKNWKLSLLTAIGFLGIGSMVTFYSCEKDPCNDLNCNQGACVEGLCQCPVGWEGPECDIASSSRFVGTYDGHLSCDAQPIQSSSLVIAAGNSPDSIVLKAPFATIPVDLKGSVATPNATFEDYSDNNIAVHAYATIDGELIAVYVQTTNKVSGTNTVCRYSGHR